MADLDDVRLWRLPDDVPPEPPSRHWIPVALLACALLGIAIGGYLFFRRAPAQKQTGQKATAQPAAPRRLPSEAGENIPLPPLDETDALVRELVSRLSKHPRVAAWLATDQLIRNFTVVVVNIADGRTPAAHLRKLAPAGSFQVIDRGAVQVDPRTFGRYDGHAAAVASIDARGAARLYATLRPRIDDAYKELGSPHGDFDRTLERAIDRLLKTPTVGESVRLEPAGALFKFSDPALESLSPPQKQLLRMGPANVRIIQAKLREIAPYLGLAAQ
jgi:hypothetical protein